MITEYAYGAAGNDQRGSRHEIAQAIAPESRVAYVDNDPTAVMLIAILQLITDEAAAPAALWGGVARKP